jgi:DNA repair protein RecN (Recombination protein N)
VLRQLHITGLGVIEDLDLEFDPGLNVLTGETGAGKTMITVGLALALGQRGSASMVRSGVGAARVQARFDATWTADPGGWAEDGELLLARTVSADGKSNARIGGQLAPVSALIDLASHLVEMYGQHQGLRFLSAAAQTEFVDRFAGAEHLARVRSFRDLRGRLLAARARLEELTALSRERERDMDLLAYQIREIESAAVRPGELPRLEAEEARLAYAERLLGYAALAEDVLSAEGAGVDSLLRVAAALREASSLDPEAQGLADRSAALAEEASDLTRDLRGYREGVVLDPARLEEVRERVGAIKALERKYGEGEEGVLAYLEEAKARFGSLASADDERIGLRSAVEDLTARSAHAARGLTRVRAETGPRLAAAVEAELRELGMEGVTVEVDRRPLAEPGPTGAERVELLFSGGPGQAPLQLSKVASGGELSRTMLACRSVMVDLDDVPTLVFDEVDAGIGGRAAVAVGKRLAALAASRQVLVVTHLPQIASFADRHIRVEKADGRATATLLEGSERVTELSRMLSGLPESEAAAVHADELLAEANRVKAGALTGGA